MAVARKPGSVIPCSATGMRADTGKRLASYVCSGQTADSYMRGRQGRRGLSGGSNKPLRGRVARAGRLYEMAGRSYPGNLPDVEEQVPPLVV